MPQPRSDEYGVPVHRRKSRIPYRLWNGARQRARKQNIPFTITREFVEAALEEGHCQVTGLPFNLDYNDDKDRNRKHRPYSASLDQTVSGKGYTPENTKVVVSIYNFAKLTFDHDDVVRLARAIVSTDGDSP